MEFVKNLRLHITPTFLIFDAHGNLMWQREGALRRGDLASARRLGRAAAGSHEHHAAQISLQRGLNRLVWALRRANDVVMRRLLV